MKGSGRTEVPSEGEMLLPILKGRPGVQKHQLQLQGRVLSTSVLSGTPARPRDFIHSSPLA